MTSAVCASVRRMSWSISASGSKEHVSEHVNALKAPTEFEDAQVDAAKAMISAFVEKAPADNVITVSASGHDDAGGGYVSCSLNSAKPAPLQTA